MNNQETTKNNTTKVMMTLSTHKVHFTQYYVQPSLLKSLPFFFFLELIQELEMTQGCYCHLYSFTYHELKISNYSAANNVHQTTFPMIVYAGCTIQ